MPMKSRQLEFLLAEKTRKTSSQIDQTLRRMREAGRIVSGPRGINAPNLTPAEAARYLIVVVGSSSPGDALATDSGQGEGVSCGGRKFREALTDLLSDPTTTVMGARLWLDSFSAEIIDADGKVETFTRPGAASPLEAYADCARESVFIGGGLIRRIAEALQ